MKVAEIFLAGELRWNVESKEPVSLPVTLLKDWQLLNPLAVSREGYSPLVIALSKTEFHVLTRQLFFLCPDDYVHDSEDTDSIIAFLRNLRLVTKQAALPTDIMMVHFSDLDFELKLEFPPVRRGSLLGTFRLKTAVTSRAIQEADQIDSAFDVHHEILLDALRALQLHDFKQAILYAAIATESMARISLDKEYRTFVSSIIPPPHMNILEFVQAGGGKIKKDPIYAALTDADSFSKLLHEVPLYLQRKSLLNEDQKLYRRAVNLYKTRNLIGHGEVMPIDDADLYSIDKEGAFKALETVIAVYAWFGIKGYVLPIIDSMRLEPN